MVCKTHYELFGTENRNCQSIILEGWTKKNENEKPYSIGMSFECIKYEFFDTSHVNYSNNFTADCNESLQESQKLII